MKFISINSCNRAVSGEAKLFRQQVGEPRPRWAQSKAETDLGTAVREDFVRIRYYKPENELTAEDITSRGRSCRD